MTPTPLVTNRLEELEKQHGFRILYACESGSRAWGFASADSDYDVRFLFVWPREHYLSISAPREDVDLGIDADNLDLSGWELRKSLRLLRKSNGPLIEWLHSPIVYRQTEALDMLRNLAREIFRPRSCSAHYLGLSKRMITALDETPDAATAKRYLYALRSLLAAGHVLRDRSPAPVAFAKLVDSANLSGAIRDEIDSMISAKAGGKESDAIGSRPVLDSYLKNQHQHHSETLDRLPEEEPEPITALDELFRQLVR